MKAGLATRRGVLLAGPWLVGAAATAATCLGLLGDRPWWLDLMAHFRLQYAVLLLPAWGIMLVARRWWSAGAFGLAWAVNVGLLLPLWVAPPPPEGVAGPSLRLVTFNVLRSNPQTTEVAEWLANQEADVILVEEVDRRWVDRLDAVLRDHRRLPTPTLRPDNFGIAVYLRHGLATQAVQTTADPADRPRITATLDLAGRAVRVVGIHTLPPVSRRASELRARQLAEAGRLADSDDEPIVLAGDFNATPWSAPLRRLRADTGLRDSARGFGHRGTWPDGLWWTGMIPIDHVLISPHWRVDGRRVGPALGSDHRPIVIDLTLMQPVRKR
jgi:endonuclease/exonuclease/phosphatase (EEP) superfamily protein YafD